MHCLTGVHAENSFVQRILEVTQALLNSSWTQIMKLIRLEDGLVITGKDNLKGPVSKAFKAQTQRQQQRGVQ